MKRCTCCGRLLELSEFHRDRGRPYSLCKACKCAASARYAMRRRDRKREAQGLAKMPR